MAQSPFNSLPLSTTKGRLAVCCREVLKYTFGGSVRLRLVIAEDGKLCKCLQRPFADEGAGGLCGYASFDLHLSQHGKASDPGRNILWSRNRKPEAMYRFCSISIFELACCALLHFNTCCFKVACLEPL